MFSGFAGIALLIAVVGVAGVLAFSVSARTREFGVRLAVGSAPRHLLARVLSEGVVIAAIGIAAGAVGGYALARLAAAIFGHVQLPGALPVTGAAAVLVGAAVVASLDAGRARLARGRAAGAPIRVGVPSRSFSTSRSASPACSCSARRPAARGTPVACGPLTRIRAVFSRSGGSIR